MRLPGGGTGRRTVDGTRDRPTEVTVKRRHALLTSLLLGLAVVAGALALTRTMALGQHAAVGDAQIARRGAQLDRAEAQVRRLRAQRPPAVPAVPATRSATRVVVVRDAQTHAEPYEHEEEGHEEDGHDD
jgi:hypothetical protein